MQAVGCNHEIIKFQFVECGSKVRHTPKKLRTSYEVLNFLSNPKDWYVIAVRRM